MRARRTEKKDQNSLLTISIKGAIMDSVKRETAQWWVAPIRIKPKKFQEIEISLLTTISPCAIIGNVKRGQQVAPQGRHAGGCDNSVTDPHFPS